jgi:hypothetical protein
MNATATKTVEVEEAKVEDNLEYGEEETQAAAAQKPLPAGQSPLRSINEIITDLSKPIKTRHLKQKTRGGQVLDFIPWYHAVKYLDLHAPGWSYEVRSTVWNTEGRLVLTVRLSIPCLEGLVYREATGTEEEPEEGERMYGDPSSNAESMALRRAAAKFGLGLYLYNKGKR